MGSTDFASVLDQLYFSARDERDKGTKFERLVKRYLELEPKYADQFSDVWLWTERPGRNGQPDTGIDLVARHRYTGELTGIQAKFYDRQRQLDKRHIDSFFTAVGKVDFAHGMVDTSSSSPNLTSASTNSARCTPPPTPRTTAFFIVGGGNDKPFSTVAVREIPDLSFWGSGQGQFFPRYTYSTSAEGDDLLTQSEDAASSAPKRIDNVTDAALAEYRGEYGPEVTKDEIFFYVYGLLHSSEYRERFAPDLKKMLPRSPKVAGVERFRSFAEAGRKLSELHIGYEAVEPHPLTERATGIGLEADAYAKCAVTHIEHGGKSGAWDKTRVIYNMNITLEGIPEDAHRYMLGSRSGPDWILERCQVKTDKASGITNDPNGSSREHNQPRYISDPIGRIVTVSIETNRIVGTFPAFMARPQIRADQGVK